MVSSPTSSQAVPDDAARLTSADLHVERSGPADGLPVLLLHGWGSSARLMQPLADGLADMYRVLNLDLPGHGTSPLPPAPWGVPEHAALVADFVRAEADGPVTIVGHSNGGRIALYMASDPSYADVIDQLVLISPSGITPQRPWTYYFRKHLANILKAPFRVLPARLRDFGLDWLRHSLLWKALGSSDYRTLQGVMRETFVKTVNCYLDDRINRIQVPVLLFWGDQDEAVSHYQMKQLEAHVPDAGLVVLEGAGHYGYLDDLATVLAGTRHFLADQETTSSGL
jgi:pimeloyl-ACP methyl ester carboxylesterase